MVAKRIIDYPKETILAGVDALIVDGTAGTRKLEAADAVWSLLESLANIHIHKAIPRYKNLGSTVTNDQIAQIHNGFFHDIWIGDYWLINDVKYHIVDIDYFYSSGGQNMHDYGGVTSHHIVVMPGKWIGDMTRLHSGNTSNYATSELCGKMQTTVKGYIPQTFQSHLLKFYMRYPENATNGAGSSNLSEIYVDNPSVMQVYGIQPGYYGNGVLNRRFDNAQFSLFKQAGREALLDIHEGRWTWLKDAASESAFYCMDNGVSISQGPPTSTSLGVRPYFIVG